MQTNESVPPIHPKVWFMNSLADAMDAPHNLLCRMTTLNVTFTSKHVIHRASSIAFRATGSETLEVLPKILEVLEQFSLTDFQWLLSV
jgi:hypothetical protein